MAGLGARTSRGVTVVVACACLAVGGCGGSDQGGGSGDGGGTSASDACDALARFDNAFGAAVDAVASGDTNAVMGAAATLKEQTISLTEALQSQATEAEPLATAVRELADAVARLPHDASPERTKAALEPRVKAVGDAVDETATGLGCPSG